MKLDKFMKCQINMIAVLFFKGWWMKLVSILANEQKHQKKKPTKNCEIYRFKTKKAYLS